MLRPTGLGRRAVILALAVAGALSAKGTGVLAQTAPSVEEGSRVRITAPSLGLTEAVGIVQEATNEELVVQFEYPRRLATVDRSDITGLDVSVERQRKVLKGLGVGALVGAGSGVLIGLASGDDEGFLALTAEEKAVIMGIGLGAVGGVVGLVVGALDRNDVWSSALPIDLDVDVVPVLRSGGAGVHVGLALRVP
jgi:hypothetical protein